MPQTSLRHFAVPLLLFSLGLPACAQEPASGAAPTITVVTRIVVLDIVVTDRAGQPVNRPLGREDFIITEDGVPQPVRNVESPAQTLGAEATASVRSAADLQRIGDAPVTVFVLDELNSRFEDMSYARQMLERYLAAQPAELQEPAALLALTNTGFRQLHDYTQERAALEMALKQHMPELPTKLGNGGNQNEGAVERMADTLAALQQISQATAGVRGRKNVLWLGNGFPTADLATLPNSDADTIETALRRIVTRLLDARITLYTINPTAETTTTLGDVDPSNADAGGSPTDPFAQGEGGFGAIAATTGGIAFVGRNDLNNVVAEGVARGQLAYTVAYSPTDRTPDATHFRRIRIAMRDPNLRAFTREGYYALPAAALNPAADKAMPSRQVKANLQMDLSAGLTQTMSYSGLKVSAKPGAAGAWSLTADGVTWNADNHAESSVAAAWFDRKGKMLGHVAREETANRRPDVASATYSLPVPLPAGVARLRLLVRDAVSGRMGTVDVLNPQ